MSSVEKLEMLFNR